MFDGVRVFVERGRKRADAGGPAAEAREECLQISAVVFRESTRVDAEEFARLVEERGRKFAFMHLGEVANAL